MYVLETWGLVMYPFDRFAETSNDRKSVSRKFFFKPEGCHSPTVESGQTLLKGLKILVVDDESDARLFIWHMLTDFGAQVQLSPSASDALRIISGERFDLLISDIGMPEQDGYDFIRTVRSSADEHVAKIPSIALTAFSSVEDRDRARDAGFGAHVAKPVDLESLLSAITSQVQKK